MDSIESEDLNEFYESLKLLHSDKSDSQRKLYHMVIKSLRKCHPTVKNAFVKKTSTNQYDVNSVLKKSVEITGKSSTYHHKHAAVDEVRHTVVDKTSLTSFMSTSSTGLGSRSSKNTEQIHLNNGPLISQPILAVADSPANLSLYKIPKKQYNESTKNDVVKINNMLPFKMGSQQPVAHSGNKDQSQITKQISPRSLLARHKQSNNFSSPVNLKKIRAVLARGDPFPTHLVKACINNITPDLQKEKL